MRPISGSLPSVPREQETAFTPGDAKAEDRDELRWQLDGNVWESNPDEAWPSAQDGFVEIIGGARAPPPRSSASPGLRRPVTNSELKRL